MSIQKHTFEGVLNFLATKESRKWFMHLQASQFELNGFKDSTNNGILCLNLGPEATRNMQVQDEGVSFNCMKHGVEQFMYVPYTAIMFIQDPDNAGNMYPWPYFADHGEDFSEPPTNVVEFTPRGAWDEANRISAKNYIDIPDVKEHSDGAKVVDMIEFRNKRELDPTMETLKEFGLVDDKGNLDIFGIAAKAKRKSEEPKPLTLEEKVGLRRWVVIEGGKQKPKASMPFIDEVHRAKQERRAQLEKLLPSDEFTGAVTIRSDGNDGTSVFFPDLDVSKCYFHTKRIERPSWLKVINGGKNVEA